LSLGEEPAVNTGILVACIAVLFAHDQHARDTGDLTGMLVFRFACICMYTHTLYKLWIHMYGCCTCSSINTRVQTFYIRKVCTITSLIPGQGYTATWS